MQLPESYSCWQSELWENELVGVHGGQLVVLLEQMV